MSLSDAIAYRFHFSMSTHVLHFCSRLAPSSAAVTESIGYVERWNLPRYRIIWISLVEELNTIELFSYRGGNVDMTFCDLHLASIPTP